MEKDTSSAQQMTENYLLYSSVALFALGSISLTLSLIFRRKSRKINGYAEKLEPNVFDRTFVIFNPYEDRKKLIHRLLSFIPWIAMFASFGFAFLTFILISSGFLLTLITVIISLNLIILEETTEAYQFSNLLTKALQHQQTNLGVGDLRLYNETKRVLPKLSTYYLALTILFITTALTLRTIPPNLLTTLLPTTNTILQTTSNAGTLGTITTTILLAATILLTLLLTRKIKNRYFQTPNKPPLHQH